MTKDDAETLSLEVTDLISVLCEARPEAFPFERLISLFGFTAWLNNPANELAPRIAMVRAGSAIFQSNLKALRDKDAKAQLVADFLTHDKLTAVVLLERFDQHEVAHEHIAPLVQIGRFFLQCPHNVTPSINRAFHFLISGGAIAELEKPISKQTLNRVWTSFAQVCPFVTVADMLGAQDFAFMSPDDDEDLRFAMSLLFGDQIRAYFEDVRAVQELLFKLFDLRTQNRFPWIRLPESLKASDLDRRDFTPYEKKQIEIINNYSAKRPPR